MRPRRLAYRSWSVPFVFVLALVSAGIGLSLASSNSDLDNANLTVAAAGEVHLDPLYESGYSGDDSTGVVPLPEILDGRPLVMNFFSSTCQPCIREMPALEAVHARLGAEVQFVGVAYADAEDRSRDLVESTGVTYDTYSDQPGDALALFNAVGLPATAFIAPNGDIGAVHVGQLSEDDMHANVTDLFDL